MHLAGESEGDGVDMVDICFSEHIIIGPWSLAIREYDTWNNNKRTYHLAFLKNLPGLRKSRRNRFSDKSC